MNQKAPSPSSTLRRPVNSAARFQLLRPKVTGLAVGNWVGAGQRYFKKREANQPATARPIKVQASTETAAGISATAPATSMPRSTPTNERVSITPVAQERSPPAAVSAIRPILAGTCRALWMPMSAKAISARVRCWPNSAKAATAMMGSSANLAQATTLALGKRLARRPPHAENIRNGATSKKEEAARMVARADSGAQVTTRKEITPFSKLSLRTPSSCTAISGVQR